MSIRLSLGSARAAAAGAAHIGSSFAASPDLQTDNDDNDEATATGAAAAAATTVTATIVEPVGPENLVVGKTVSSVVAAAAAAGRLRLQLAAGYKYFGNVAQTL